LENMVEDEACTIGLIIAGSTSAEGCMKVYEDMLIYRMADFIVATGATIVDMAFFEAVGGKHYKGTPNVDDNMLRSLYIDRIYDVFIDEEKLQACDMAIYEIANSLEARPYSSREFILEMGKWLKKNSGKPRSIIEIAAENNIPIFCPAFSDSSAGFGLVKHQRERIKAGKPYVSIDSVADFRELTEIKIRAGRTGLFMIGGGVPKNFVQDTVVCAEVAFGLENVEMHKYAVQITVADMRDGACSSSTLSEAASWGKVETSNIQMVYAEATSVLPLMISYVYHKGAWKNRVIRNWANLFTQSSAALRYHTY
jgi:deoxyhypusine synthase